MNVVPLCVRLAGRKCVIVGGGRVATRRVYALVESGADMTVVAPTLTAELRSLHDSGRIGWIEGSYSEESLRGAFLVVIASDDDALNDHAAADARLAGCLVNDADEPDRGDCVFPAVVRRGDLLISVTTSGASPSLTARLRDRFETEIGPEYEAYVTILRDVREAVLNRVSEREVRRSTLNALAEDTRILELIRAGKIEEARTRAFACISLSPD